MGHETKPSIGTFVASLAIVFVLAMQGCSNSNAPAAPACDQACQDRTAVQSLRFGMKLLFNLTLQGKDVGAQDTGTVPCQPPGMTGGTVHIFGTATSNVVQGATFVDLTYVLDHCVYQQTDNDPTQTATLTFTGTVTQKGTLAELSTATTALGIASDSLTVTGTVEDPPIDYTATACTLTLTQNGNGLSGSFCGRDVGLTL